MSGFMRQAIRCVEERSQARMVLGQEIWVNRYKLAVAGEVAAGRP